MDFVKPANDTESEGLMSTIFRLKSSGLLLRDMDQRCPEMLTYVLIDARNGLEFTR